jgi:hypothetical protein
MHSLVPAEHPAHARRLLAAIVIEGIADRLPRGAP